MEEGCLFDIYIPFGSQEMHGAISARKEGTETWFCERAVTENGK